MKEENTFFPAAGPGDKGAGARPGPDRQRGP